MKMLNSKAGVLISGPGKNKGKYCMSLNKQVPDQDRQHKHCQGIAWYGSGYRLISVIPER